jgi:hypothetical protein
MDGVVIPGRGKRSDRNEETTHDKTGFRITQLTNWMTKCGIIIPFTHVSVTRDPKMGLEMEMEMEMGFGILRLAGCTV